MFIVTNSTPNGCYTPSVFVHKKDATIFKRNLALNDAYLSSFGENYAETLDDSDIDVLNALFRRIGEDLGVNDFNEKENTLIEGFVTFLEENGCNLTDSGDYINYSDETFNYIEVFEVPAPSDMETSVGKASAVSYNDGCAKGIQILLDDNIVCALDVYEEERGGEARVLAYKIEYGEDEEEAPISCTTINR